MLRWAVPTGGEVRQGSADATADPVEAGAHRTGFEAVAADLRNALFAQADALRKKGGMSAQELAPLVKLLYHDIPAVARLAAAAIGRAGPAASPHVSDHLQTALMHDSQEVRETAAASLRAIDTPEDDSDDSMEERREIAEEQLISLPRSRNERTYLKKVNAILKDLAGEYTPPTPGGTKSSSNEEEEEEEDLVGTEG